MNALVAALQAVPGGVGAAIMFQLFKMWRRGDLIPKQVLAIMEEARKEDREQIRILMAAVTEMLQRSEPRPRHGREP